MIMPTLGPKLQEMGYRPVSLSYLDGVTFHPEDRRKTADYLKEFGLPASHADLPTSGNIATFVKRTSPFSLEKVVVYDGENTISEQDKLRHIFASRQKIYGFNHSLGIAPKRKTKSVEFGLVERYHGTLVVTNPKLNIVNCDRLEEAANYYVVGVLNGLGLVGD